MGNVHILEKANGTVAVTTLTPEFEEKVAKGETTVDAILQKVKDSLVGDETVVNTLKDQTSDKLPLNTANAQGRQRTYRNAWRMVDGKVQVSMSDAKNIHLGNIRRKRDGFVTVEGKRIEGALDALDKEYTIAQRQGDTAKLAELDVTRQQLLDATEQVKNTTYENQAELYNDWPAILDKRKG